MVFKETPAIITTSLRASATKLGKITSGRYKTNSKLTPLAGAPISTQTGRSSIKHQSFGSIPLVALTPIISLPAIFMDTLTM